MAAEHAGAAGPDPRELIERLRKAAGDLPLLTVGDHTCLDQESTRSVIDLHNGAADALEALEADRNKAKVALLVLLKETNDLLEASNGALAEAKARIAALEAENALLLNGWPGADQRASVYHTDHYRNPDMWPGGVIPADIMEVPPGWCIYRGMELDEVGPHDSRREAILAYCEINTASAHLGLDAPAGGGE